MAEEKVETPEIRGWDAVADIMETFAAFFFIATLVTLTLPLWIPLAWFAGTAVLLILAGRVRAYSEARRQEQETSRQCAANRRNDEERARRQTVREEIARMEIIISAERIITLAELGAHAAVQAAVKDILDKYPSISDQSMPGQEFLAKMDRRAGRPRVDRDIDALREALAEVPMEKTA